MQGGCVRKIGVATADETEAGGSYLQVHTEEKLSCWGRCQRAERRFFVGGGLSWNWRFKVAIRGKR